MAGLFLYSSFGFYLVQLIYLGQCSVSSCMSSPSARVEKLLLSSDDFEKTGDDELIYKGKMYDIISTESAGDKTLFYVLHDEAEDHIMAAINFHIQRFFESSSKSSCNPVKHAVKFSIHDYLTISTFHLNASLSNPLDIRTPEIIFPENYAFSNTSPPPWVAWFFSIIKIFQVQRVIHY